jgi:hypothetical protein
MAYGGNDWLALTQDPPWSRRSRSAIPIITFGIFALPASPISGICFTN